MQFRTIQRADLLVAILTPPAVILATINGKLTILLIAAATVAAIRAMFVRSVLTAFRVSPGQTGAGHRRLATVHDLADLREARELASSEVADLN